MGLHCAVDLHGNNGFYGIMDDTGKRIFKKRIENSLPAVLTALEPYRSELDSGVVVESTYNWYWLVDGLNENGFKVRLANPAVMEQYNGLKNADDETDTFFLAELSRLNILPEGHVYPKEHRTRKKRARITERTATGISVGHTLKPQISSGGIVPRRKPGIRGKHDEASRSWQQRRWPEKYARHVIL